MNNTPDLDDILAEFSQYSAARTTAAASRSSASAGQTIKTRVAPAEIVSTPITVTAEKSIPTKTRSDRDIQSVRRSEIRSSKAKNAKHTLPMHSIITGIIAAAIIFAAAFAAHILLSSGSSSPEANLPEISLSDTISHEAASIRVSAEKTE